jgi:exodeoxyribonuclease VII small subunit
MFWRLLAQNSPALCRIETPCPINYEVVEFRWTFPPGSGITIDVGADELVKFEECLERLEKIVQELEKGEVPLEKSLTLFEEGMQLSATCRKQLEDAEGKVEILLKQNGKLQTEPFEPPAEKALRK